MVCSIGLYSQFPLTLHRDAAPGRSRFSKAWIKLTGAGSLYPALLSACVEIMAATFVPGLISGLK